MRVLHFFKTYFPETFGGVEQVIYQIIRGTEKQGIHSEVLSLINKKAEKTVKVDNHLVHRSRLNFQIASTGISFSSISHFIKHSKQADIIHYHFPWPFMDLVHFLTKIRKPTIVTYHSDIVRQKYLYQIYRPLMRQFLNKVDRIVSTSPNYVNTSPVLKHYREKTTVIPIGLNQSLYPNPILERIEQCRSRFGNRFFLFVGVLRYYKGLHILLEALRGTNYPVVIVGSGPMEFELKEQTRKLELKNIHFLGFVSDEYKVALMRSSYAFVFPSHLRSEAFGVSLLEAAMYAKPMISTEIGTGTSYINIDRKTGLVVSPNDSNALRSAMQYIWEHPSKAVKMGELAKERFHELFTADKMAQHYVALYHELLS